MSDAERFCGVEDACDPDPEAGAARAAGPGRERARGAIRQIAIYGKGGIGKSTTVSNLAMLLGMSGHRVLLVGCDPKHDSSYKVSDRRPVPTVLGLLQQQRSHDLKLSDFFIEGRHGVNCIEAGGPEPGVGCAGRGLSKMFELFETMDLYEGQHDVILYDVLGDVVCGGFAVPMREGYATEVLVVVSGEVMSLYAANNICRALVRLKRGGARLVGLIGNLRDAEGEREVLDAFAARLGTRVLHCVGRHQLILDAERERRTVVEYAPDSEATADYRRLQAAIEALTPEDRVIPKAMSDTGFDEFIRTRFAPTSQEEAPPEPPAGFQPDAFCAWLMRALTGADIRCEQVRFEADGHLGFRMASDSASSQLRLGPAEFAPEGESLDLGFALLRPEGAEDEGEWRSFARHVGRRLLAVRKRYRVPALELLRLDQPDEVFAFAPGLFHWRIGDLLVAGQTRYGPYLYAGEHFDGERLLYRFESAEGSIQLSLEMGEGGGADALRTQHLSLRVIEDERTPAERALLAHQVERYLGFLLSLSDPPSARFAYRHRTDAVVAGSTQDWGSDLSLQFFADPGFDFLANYYTAFGLRWPVAYVFHGERECSHTGDYTPGPFQSFVEHAMHIRPLRGMSSRVFHTDLREADTIMGGEDRLRETLIEVGNRPEIATVIVQDTCAVRVAGDDIRRCIDEVQPQVRAPLLYLDATAMDDAAPFASIRRFWRELLEAVPSADEPAPAAAASQAIEAPRVNLIGYGLSDDPCVEELSALLERIGVQRNASLFPGLDRDEASRFRQATANLVTPWQYAVEASSEVCEWSLLPTSFPPLPYGREGTRRWLDAIRASLGREEESPPGAVDMNEAQLVRWQSLQGRARGLGVAFALVSTQAARLLEATRILGVPVASMIGEMGFDLRVLYHDPERVQQVSARVDPASFEAALRALVGPEVRVQVEAFAEAEALPGLLASPGIDLVYSEIRDDPRIRAAGKAQLSLVDLRMGFEGALDSLERVLHRIRPTLRQRFGAYLEAP
ncbi:MAG: AAA family ATPase [Myxococcales bacterium]|nr:AAA family ATPase [Myxococcales bacterium]